MIESHGSCCKSIIRLNTAEEEVKTSICTCTAVVHIVCTAICSN